MSLKYEPSSEPPRLVRRNKNWADPETEEEDQPEDSNTPCGVQGLGSRVEGERLNKTEQFLVPSLRTP